MNEEKTLEEYEKWIGVPADTNQQTDFGWDVWQAACASKQKEIVDLEANLREQHQNQLDLLELLGEAK